MIVMRTNFFLRLFLVFNFIIGVSFWLVVMWRIMKKTVEWRKMSV